MRVHVWGKVWLIALGLAVLGSFCSQAQDPADEFLKAYFLIQDGDTAKKAGEKDKAIEKYNGALGILKKIQVENPDWNPNIINFRIRHCSENISALGGTAAAPAPSGEGAGATAPPAAAGGATDQRITELQNELTTTRQQLDTVRKEKEDLESKLKSVEENLKSVTAGKGDERIQELQKQNDDLRKQLGAAEEKLKSVPAAGGEGALAQLQQELSETKKQLDAALQENEKLRKANEDLKASLEESRGRLKALASSDETIKNLMRENQLLRAIVERAYQEDAKRIDQKNQIKTDLTDQKARIEALEQQIVTLSTPLTPLSNDEKELLKSPTIVIREPSTGGSTPSTGAAVQPGGAEASRKLSGESAELAKAARESYEKGDFDVAATKYEEILKTEPDNIFSLSNLGVIRFRQERLGEAETLLNKALELDPTDAFSRSVLGIIHYRQGSYDEAISELTRAIALDSKAPEPHNYLGITYSQKGYQEAAEKELLKAVELKPDYGDAHFNLAVVYATQNPPSLTLARKHYKRALELNVPPDQELEKIFGNQ